MYEVMDCVNKAAIKIELYIMKRILLGIHLIMKVGVRYRLCQKRKKVNSDEKVPEGGLSIQQSSRATLVTFFNGL